MAQYQNPFLRGMLGSQQQAQQQQLGQLQAMGMLSSLEQQQVERQLMPLKIEQLKLSLEKARRNQELTQNLMGGGSGGGAAPLAFSEGGMSLPGGAQGNAMTGQVVPAPRPQQGGMGGVPPQIMGMLASGDPGLMAIGKAMLEQQKPIATREGGGIYRPGVGWELTPQPKTEAGIQYNPLTREASAVSGYGPAIASIEGAKTGATELARAGLDLVPVPDGKGGTVMMPRSRAVQMLGGQQPLPQQVPVAPIGPLAQQSSLRGAIGNIAPEAPSASNLAQIDAELARNPSGQARTILEQERATLAPQLGAAPSASQAAGAKKREEIGVKREAELPQAQLRLRTQINDIDRLTKIAIEAMNAPSLARSVGLVGAFPSIPGQPAANVDSLIASLQAQVSGMKLQNMRDASKTGGAVGQVTEREWPRLESMIVALNKKMSPELFREKLSELVQEMNKMKGNLNSAFEQEYSGVMPQRRRNDAANDPLGIRR